MSMEGHVIIEDAIAMREYSCGQCKWVNYVPILYFTEHTICPLCYTREYYYILRELYPKLYREQELLADINYRLFDKDKLLLNKPVRAENHWSYVYKNYLDNILRNLKGLDMDVLSHVTDMLTGVY